MMTIYSVESALDEGYIISDINVGELIFKCCKVQLTDNVRIQGPFVLKSVPHEEIFSSVRK